MEFDLEIEKIKSKISKTKAKTVLIQLPDGLKPKATEIAEQLKKKGVDIFIWAGSCYGACDLPQVDFDLIVQFGHAKLD